MRDHLVLVYGAAGYTGRLVCEELARRNVRFALAGRDRGKLLALRSELSQQFPDDRLPSTEAVFSAPLDAPADLDRALASAQVVLDCAGPFALHGKPVQDAALRSRTHFLDITGELSYMLETQRRHDEARRQDIALVNAVGFDVVPTDVVAALAAQALTQVAPGSGRVQRVEIAFAGLAGRPSRGTLRSILAQLTKGGPSGAVYERGRWQGEPMGQRRWKAPFPAPVGALHCISVPWGDLATAPRTTGADEVHCYMALPPKMARLMPIVGRGIGLLGLPILRDLAARGIDRLPEGASAEERTRAKSAVVAQATAQDGQHVTAGMVMIEAYQATAIAAVICAEWAAQPSFAARGALTPTQAFTAEALRDALVERGAATAVRIGQVSR